MHNAKSSNIVDVDKNEDMWMVTARDSRRTRTFVVRSLFVASVTSSGHNTLRYPTMRDRLHAKRKPVTTVSDLALPNGTSMHFEWVTTDVRATEWIEAESDEEKGRLLARRLKDRGWVEE